MGKRIISEKKGGGKESKFIEEYTPLISSQLSATLMQLLFSFDRDMKVEKTLMKTLASQFSSTLIVSSLFDKGQEAQTIYARAS